MENNINEFVIDIYSKEKEQELNARSSVRTFLTTGMDCNKNMGEIVIQYKAVKLPNKIQICCKTIKRYVLTTKQQQQQ